MVVTDHAARAACEGSLMERGRHASRVADRQTISSPEPISREGRLAGYTTAGCLILTGLAFTVAAVATMLWGLGLVFAAGLAVAATRFPNFTCPSGGHVEPALGLCIRDGGERYDATSWSWLKSIVTVAGVGLGVSIMRWSRAVWLTAPLAVIAWITGFGALLADTLARGLLP
jgi:hypothetical protein